MVDERRIGQIYIIADDRFFSHACIQGVHAGIYPSSVAKLGRSSYAGHVCRRPEVLHAYYKNISSSFWQLIFCGFAGGFEQQVQFLAIMR